MVLRAKHTEFREVNGNKMAYRYLGNTGMKVSVLAYGNWLTNDKDTAETQKLCTESIKKCFDNGINFFDTAEMYAYGASETQMGKGLKELNAPRKDLVIATKLFRVGDKSPND